MRERANKQSWQECSQKSPWFYTFFYLPVPCTLGILATGKRVNYGGKYGLAIPGNFHFQRPEKLKNEVLKVKENLNETVKHCLK